MTADLAMDDPHRWLADHDIDLHNVLDRRGFAFTAGLLVGLSYRDADLAEAFAAGACSAVTVGRQRDER